MCSLHCDLAFLLDELRIGTAELGAGMLARAGMQWKTWPTPTALAALPSFYEKSYGYHSDEVAACEELLETYIHEVSLTVAYQRLVVAALLHEVNDGKYGDERCGQLHRATHTAWQPAPSRADAPPHTHTHSYFPARAVHVSCSVIAPLPPPARARSCASPSAF